MTVPIRLWMRHETRSTECRAPIVPAHARQLVADGFAVTVEESPQRVFASTEYAVAGCHIVEPGSWIDAPADTYVIGLKELPGEPAALRHRHVFFGHAYKGQPGSGELLRRFAAGGGTLLDLEYLTDEHGRRITAFGFWAGYVGAALAVLHYRGRLDRPLRPLSKPELDEMLARPSAAAPASLVLGALGRAGRGALAALAVAGIDRPTPWDVEETRVLDLAALLDHEIMVNTVFTGEPVTPFLTASDLDRTRRRLAVICDVTCDVGSACNVLPVYSSTTSWLEPARLLHPGPPRLDIIAIDNLPSLLPREASATFSADLLPQLRTLGEPGPPWRRCEQLFRSAREAAPDDLASVD